MAHRSSAFKHIRADKRKRDVSFRRKSAVRTIVKKTKVAIETGNVEEAESLFRRATSLLDRAVSKGVIKKGTAIRRKSRLAKSLHLASTH